MNKSLETKLFTDRIYTDEEYEIVHAEYSTYLIDMDILQEVCLIKPSGRNIEDIKKESGDRLLKMASAYGKPL